MPKTIQNIEIIVVHLISNRQRSFNNVPTDILAAVHKGNEEKKHTHKHRHPSTQHSLKIAMIHHEQAERICTFFIVNIIHIKVDDKLLLFICRMSLFVQN